MLLILLLLVLIYSIHSYILINKWNIDTKLYMNKGFGKPSTATSSFKYVGNVKPGIRGPKRIVDPSIMRPDYAETGNMYTIL